MFSSSASVEITLWHPERVSRALTSQCVPAGVASVKVQLMVPPRAM